MNGQKTGRQRVNPYDLVAIFKQAKMIRERSLRPAQKRNPYEPPRSNGRHAPLPQESKQDE